MTLKTIQLRDWHGAMEARKERKLARARRRERIAENILLALSTLPAFVTVGGLLWGALKWWWSR